MNKTHEADKAEFIRVMNTLIENETNPDKVADLQIFREWLTNPTFRKAAADMVAEQNGVA
jgi:hypothetical protein